MKRLYEKKGNNFMGSLNVQMNTVLTLTCDSEIFFFFLRDFKTFLVIIMITNCSNLIRSLRVYLHL